jgi:hypothetical protein
LEKNQNFDNLIESVTVADIDVDMVLTYSKDFDIEDLMLIEVINCFLVFVDTL